jgi:predicted kinase
MSRALCSRHGLPFEPISGAVDLEDLGFSRLSQRVSLSGLPAARCPRCREEGAPASVGEAWRGWVRSLVPTLGHAVGPDGAPLHLSLHVGGGDGEAAPAPGPARPAAAPAAARQEHVQPGAAEGGWTSRPARHGLDRVVLAADTAAEVNLLLSALRHADALRGWGIPGADRPLRLLLCGPPGTGKNTLAEALAHAIGRPILEASPASVESSLVGQAARNIEALFRAAEEQGAVLFVDEADPLIGARVESPRSSADHGLNLNRVTFFRMLERAAVPVVLATNLPKVSDPAVRRRLTAVLTVALPDLAARERLLAMLLPASVPLGDARASILAAAAAETEGLAGGHIEKACRTAALRAAERTGGVGPLTLDDLRHGIQRARADEEALGAAAPRVRVEEVAEGDLPTGVRGAPEAR